MGLDFGNALSVTNREESTSPSFSEAITRALEKYECQ
jgi:hypothetical protein